MSSPRGAESYGNRPHAQGAGDKVYAMAVARSDRSIERRAEAGIRISSDKVRGGPGGIRIRAKTPAFRRGTLGGRARLHGPATARAGGRNRVTGPRTEGDFRAATDGPDRDLADPPRPRFRASRRRHREDRRERQRLLHILPMTPLPRPRSADADGERRRRGDPMRDRSGIATASGRQRITRSRRSDRGSVHEKTGSRAGGIRIDGRNAMA